MRDPQTREDADKAKFFRGEWREVPPTDWRPLGSEAVRQEQSTRREIHKVSATLEPICLVCGEEIPAHHPDFLLTNESTGRKYVGHYTCEMPSQDEDGAAFCIKKRHCVGGIEVQEDRGRVS